MTGENSYDIEPPLTQPAQTFLERHGISPILFAFISLILIFFLYQGLGGVVTIIIFGVNLTQEQASGLRIATLFGQLLFILIPTLMLTRLATHDVKFFFRFRAPPPATFFISFVGIFSLQQVLQVYMVYQEKIPFPESIQRFIDSFKQLFEQTYAILVGSSSVPELIFVMIVIALVPAVAEELLFRGMVQRSFELGLGSRRGLWLTALIFAAYHVNPFSFIPLIILGVYLGFLVIRTNSLFTSMAAHFYNNALASVAIYFGKKENYLVTGDPETLSHMELLSTFVLFSVVFFLSTYYFIRVTQSVNVENRTTEESSSIV
jgi:membrane protease YdiL (CAAX protease family)